MGGSAGSCGFAVSFSGPVEYGREWVSTGEAWDRSGAINNELVTPEKCEEVAPLPFRTPAKDENSPFAEQPL